MSVIQCSLTLLLVAWQIKLLVTYLLINSYVYCKCLADDAKQQFLLIKKDPLKKVERITESLLAKKTCFRFHSVKRYLIKDFTMSTLYSHRL